MNTIARLHPTRERQHIVADPRLEVKSKTTILCALAVLRHQMWCFSDPVGRCDHRISDVDIVEHARAWLRQSEAAARPDVIALVLTLGIARIYIAMGVPSLSATRSVACVAPRGERARLESVFFL